MVVCDRCGAGIDGGGEYVDLRHHRANMTFESRFCSADCAVAYLDDGLLEEG